MDSENFQNKRPGNYAGPIKVICIQQHGLLLSSMVTLQCQINSKTWDSSAVLYQEDYVNGTAELLGGAERATTLHRRQEKYLVIYIRKILLRLAPIFASRVIQATELKVTALAQMSLLYCLE